MEDITHERLQEALGAALAPGMSPEAAARAAFVVLCALASDEGQDPAWEVWIKTPDEAHEHVGARCWMVCWEAGPSTWGVGATFLAMRAIGRLVETHWGFDLLFWDEEVGPL